MVPLVDCHLHLQDEGLQPYLAEVIQRARTAGVPRWVSNGTGERDWARLAELARTYSGLVPCFGVHPWYVRECSDQWQRVLEGYLDSVPSAVGEIGLDRWVMPRDEQMQEEIFRQQLEIARRRRVPAMIHCLRAWEWLVDVLEDVRQLPPGILIHAYGGGVAWIERLTQMGAYFSFAGNVFEPKRESAREAMKMVPADRLLLETDSPDMLPPAEYRKWEVIGKDNASLNEPANLREILRGAANVLGQSEESLAMKVHANAKRFFGALIE